jgi:hypothetical protein
MSKTHTVRSIRLLPASYGIEKLSYEEGEVFYDKQNATLRVMNGVAKGGFPIATEEFVTTELTAVENDLQTQINAAIAAIPQVDLTPYYTKSETDVLLQNVTVDLTGYATENYVTQQISAIPQVDLTGYATEIYVNNAITNLVDGAPGALDTLNELSAALGDDENFATTITNQLALKEDIANLGTAAYQPTTAFATAFQGQLADDAVQPLDNVSVLVNDAGYLTSTSLTGLATETYVDTAITNLVDGAPDALNTLNELAAALGDNANIGSEVLTAISLKANTADLSAVATSNNYYDLDNIENWADYNQRYKGRFIAASAITKNDPLVINLDNTVTTVAQEQSYIFDTFTTYNNIAGNSLSIPGGSNFSPVSDTYGALRNGPQTHQYARLGNYIFSFTPTGNDGYLSAFTEDPTTGALQHIRSDLFSNISAFHSGGVIPSTLVADTDNNQLIILSIATNTSTGMLYRIVEWNSTDNIFASITNGNVSTTSNGQRLGNSDCQKIAAYYDETHSKIMVMFDYGIRAYFATYTNAGGANGVSSSTYIDTDSGVLGAGILFQAYEPLIPMPTTGNYLIVWGYNTTSMKQVVIDSNGDPSWGDTLDLDNNLQDVMVNTSINRIAALSMSNGYSSPPTVSMYTFYADGTFGDPETAVEVDDGTLSGTSNTARGHFDHITKKYLVYSYFNNGSTNRQRPAWSIDGKTWNYEPDLQAGDARVIDGHYSGDVAVHQLLFEGNNNQLRQNLYTTTTGPIVSNLTQDNLVGIAGGNYTKGNIAKVFTLGDVADGFTDLIPGRQYYVTDSGAITNNSSIASVKLGTPIDETQMRVSLANEGSGGVTVGTAPQDLATDGDLWWDSNAGRLKVYYVDADTAQWVDASPPASPANVPYVVGSVAGSTVFGSGFSSNNTSTGVYAITFNTALDNANYAVFAYTEAASDNITQITSKTTGGFTLNVFNSAGNPSTTGANFTVYNIG